MSFCLVLLFLHSRVVPLHSMISWLTSFFKVTCLLLEIFSGTRAMPYHHVCFLFFFFKYLFDLFLTFELAVLAFEGKVGAMIWGGTHFVTTPNMDCIYAPPKNARMSFKVDMRLGDDDYLLWPQPWIPECAHYAAIPREPQNDTPDSMNSILFHKAKPTDFVRTMAGPLSGLGNLRNSLLLDAKKFVKKIVDPQLKKYMKGPQPSKTPILPNLHTLIHRALVHLENLPLTCTQVLFVFSELQRYLLEFVACYEFMEVYGRRMDGLEGPAQKVDNVIGCFVHTVEHADLFLRAGLPVWLIRPAEFVGTVRIDKVVQPISPQDMLCLDDASCRFSVTFKGAATDVNKYRTFARYSRTYLSFSDPFQAPLFSAASTLPHSSATSLALPTGVVGSSGKFSRTLSSQAPSKRVNTASSSKHRASPCKSFH